LRRPREPVRAAVALFHVQEQAHSRGVSPCS
jgi:hypothetical protein